MNNWFRSWHGAPTDNKWLVIAKHAGVSPGIVSAFVWALLDHASQSENRGDVSGFDIETYATYSGFAETQCNAMKRALEEKRFIVDGRVSNWDKRQASRDDSSTDRVRKYREKQRVSGMEPYETQCNSREEKIREDKNKKDKTASAPFDVPAWIDKRDWDDFEQMRVKRRKPMTDRARQLALGKLANLRDQGHNPSELIQAAIMHGWDSFYPPKAPFGKPTRKVVSTQTQAEADAIFKEAMGAA